jgi:signal transduction histidine kinase
VFGINVRQADDTRVVGTAHTGQTTGLTQREKQLQAENARLIRQHNLDRSRKRRYQVLTLAGLLIATVLSGVLYLSRRRLHHTNLQLKKQVESNERSQQQQGELTARLAQAERMESLGALAGGIAHDFNNLLVGVVCNAEVLQMFHEQTPDSKKCVDGILKAAETASGLSRKMLAYAGRQPSEKRPVDLNEVVQPIVSLVQSGLIHRNINFTASDKPAIATVDNTQVEQIVLNLIHNANEAIGDKEEGLVHVSIVEEHIRDSTSDPHLLGKAVPGGNYVAIEVRDNGPGIDTADIPRMFEPFQSSHPERGRGLGLAIVYGHVNRHEGLIRVQSEFGYGTTIRILLPRSTHSTAANQTTSTAKSSPK